MKMFLTLSAIFVIFACAGCAGFGLSSDEELIERFNKHRSEFDELVKTFSDERNITALRSDGMHTYETSIGSKGMNPEKLQRYSDLLQELRLEIVSLGSDDSEIEMVANTRGLYDEGEAKGYLFSRRKLNSGIRDSLNSFSTQSSSELVRPIAKNWYLFLSVTR